MTKLLGLLIIVVGLLMVGFDALGADQLRLRLSLPEAEAPVEPPPDLGDLESLPLLTAADLTPDGGQRFPNVCGSYTTETSPQLGIARNHSNGDIYINTRVGVNGIGQFTPHADWVNSSTISSLNYMTCAQGIVDPIENKNDEADFGIEPGASLHGMLVYGNRLIGNVRMYYDANDDQRKAFWSRPLNLSTTGDVLGLTHFFDGDIPDTTEDVGGAGFSSGYMTHIPAEWQTALGGFPVAAGQCCLSVITRTSLGPALGGIDPADIGQPGEPHHWEPFVYYDNSHRTLGEWEAQQEYFGIAHEVRGVAMIAETRTVLFFGRRGNGPYCYGSATNDPELHGTDDPSDPNPEVTMCYDLASNAKGTHAYPYVHFVWAYDMLDFAKVVAGEINPSTGQVWRPWDVVPYDGWEMTFPVATPNTSMHYINGAEYDSANKKLYLVQGAVDEDGFKHGGLLWRYSVDTTP